MRLGMKHKDTIPRMIVLDLRDQYKNALELDLETITVPKDVKKVIESIKEYILPSIEKLKDFLENEYLCKCTDKLGLYAISGGLDIYKGLLEEQTMRGYTAKDIHDLGLREVDRLTKKLNALKRKMKFKGSLQDFYKKTRLPFKAKEQVIKISKAQQKEIYEKIYKKYFNVELKESELADIVRIKDNKSSMYAFYIGTKKDAHFM